MSFKALFYAYVFGGLTLLPLVAFGFIFFTIYTSVPVGDPDPLKEKRVELEQRHEGDEDDEKAETAAAGERDVNDLPKSRKSWLTMRRTYQETDIDGSYVSLVRGFLDARSKDPKRARPKDMWLAVLKGTVLFLYEDEEMTECEAVLDLAAHDVVVYPEGQLDAELFSKRNAVMLRPRQPPPDGKLPSITKEMRLADDGKPVEEQVAEGSRSTKRKQAERERLLEAKRQRDAARQQASNIGTPWFIFFRNNVEMEDWYHSLIHASDHPANSPMLLPFEPIFRPSDMEHLVETLDEQPDVIPTRWLNALLGRVFFSFYRTKLLESYIIGRLMKKLDKVKRPAFLTEIAVREVSVGNRPPMLSRPMLKELTKEGDAAIEVHLHYKGEFRITLEATAILALGGFKSYTVKLVLAAILREIEGNLLVKIKRPPSNRMWYGFTQNPKMDLVVEPIVSDRQITWTMITSTIESKLKEIILESVVLPNMDDIAFFNSRTREHRGGIWADSARPSEADQESEEEETGETTPMPVSSAPDLTKSPPITSISPAESVIGTSPPTGTLRDDNRSNSAPTEHIDLHTSSTTSSTTSLPQKRRTWLAGSRDSPYTESPSIEEPQRGRSTEADIPSSLRSQSTPGVLRPDDASARSDQTATHLTPSLTRRSSSHGSRTSVMSDDEPDMSNALDSYESSTQLSTSAPSTPSLTRTTSSSSSRASAGATSSAASQASSFLSTLKARAAATDKQALSNQAKETMRKWGMNWSRLRNNSVGDNDAPDAGEEESERATTPLGSSRPTFADMRAKVEERKASRTYDSPRASSPVPILGASTGDRVRTISSGNETAFPIVPAPEDGVGPSSSPAMPRYTQPPRPKTMSIPGIHASHKGEVMSMGYTPPAPAMVPNDPASKTSVYSRLWKASAANQASSGSGAGALNASSSDDPFLEDTTPPAAHAPSSSSPPAVPEAGAASSTKPASISVVPPPLPPRNAPRPAAPDSPASAALELIRSRDEGVRAGSNGPPDTRPPGQAPPLPPRKTKVPTDTS